jgi:PKD repeat protein
MQLENFTTIQGLVTVNWARIDSLTNFPCGITWQSNKLQYNGGETGCIYVSGTTTDPVGQYRLGIYMTVNVSVLGQTLEQGGEIGALIDQLGQLGLSLPGLDLKYYSRVIDPGNSCPAIDTSSGANNLTASGVNCPGVVSVSISGNTSICSGQSTTLTANAANATGTVAYSWSTGSTSQSVTVATAGSISVTVTDQNGSATSSVTIAVNPAPTASFTATTSGLTATVANSSSGGATYSWNFGDSQTSSSQTPPAHTYASDGNYTITLIVTSSAGCKDTATQNVTVGCPLPTADFSAVPSGLDVMTDNSSVGATSYFWDFGDGDTSSAASPSHIYDSSGTYTITLVATNSCGSDTTTEDVTVTGGVFVNSIENDLRFDVFPNPSNGLVSVILPSESAGKNYELSILDLAGKKVFEAKLEKVHGSEQKRLDLSRLTEGTYIIQLKTGDRVGIKKLDLR